MQTNNNRGSYRYNPLDSEDQQAVSIQTDNPSYHDIKIYNALKDNLWQLLSDITLSEDFTQILQYAKQICVMYQRADSVWQGIGESVKVKTEKMKIATQSFKYGGEMSESAAKIKRYIEFQENPAKFINEYGVMEKDYEEYSKKDSKGKIEMFKEKIAVVIENADKKWGQLAAQIGFGMPLSIAEEKELFFRG